MNEHYDNYPCQDLRSANMAIVELNRMYKQLEDSSKDYVAFQEERMEKVRSKCRWLTSAALAFSVGLLGLSLI